MLLIPGIVSRGIEDDCVLNQWQLHHPYESCLADNLKKNHAKRSISVF